MKGRHIRCVDTYKYAQAHCVEFSFIDNITDRTQQFTSEE